MISKQQVKRKRNRQARGPIILYFLKLVLLLVFVSFLPGGKRAYGGAWLLVNTTNSPGNLTGHSLVTIDNRVYLFGGAVVGGDGLSLQDNIYVFDGDAPNLGWVEMPTPASRPPARANHSATVMDGKMVIYGGAAGGTPLGDMWVYDPMAKTWVQKSVGGPARTHHRAVVSNGKMYLVGGIDSGGMPSAEMWEYDPTYSSWTQGTDYPGPFGGTYGVSVFTLGSKIMVSGTTGDSYYVYNPRTDTWDEKTAANSFPDRVSPGTAQVGDYGYVFGGEDLETGQFGTDVWKADLTQDPVQWEPEPSPMPNCKPEIHLGPDLLCPLEARPGYTPPTLEDNARLLYGCLWEHFIHPDPTYPSSSIDPTSSFSAPIWGDACTFLFWPNLNSAGALAGVTLLPDDATVEVGRQRLFSASGHDANGFYVPITSTWSATGGNITDSGRYTAGDLPGVYQVCAEDGPVADQANVTITGADICPDLAPGESWNHTFGYTGTFPYHDGANPNHKGVVVVHATLPARSQPQKTKGDTPNTTWDVSITEAGFEPSTVTIGIDDMVRWSNTGTSIHAVNGGLSSVLFGIEVSPDAVTLQVGHLQQFTARGYNEEENEIPVGAILWNATGGIIHEGTGLYTATDVGDYTVTCEAPGTGISGTATVHVNPGPLNRIEVTPGEVTLQAGQTQQLTATGYDTQNNEVPIDPAWSATGGTIDQNGLYTATQTGDFTVTATDQGIPGTATVHVNPGPLDRIEVTPGVVTLQTTQTQQFSATGYDTQNNEVPIDPAWSATGGTIDQNGLYTATQTGDFTVTATDQGISDSAIIHVNPGPLDRIEVTPEMVTLQAGQTQQFTATGYDTLNNEFPIDPAWSATGGTIDQNGLYTATQTGDFTVTATDQGIPGATIVHVNPGPLDRIEVTPGEVTLQATQTQQFTAAGYDVQNNEIPINPAWSATGGTIDQNGLYTATQEGDFTVTATVSGDPPVSRPASVHVAEIPKGDVNCDGSITPGDALCAFWRAILGSFQEECSCAESEQAADVNCDGTITPGDALCIFWRSILGDWTEECICEP